MHTHAHTPTHAHTECVCSKCTTHCCPYCHPYSASACSRLPHPHHSRVPTLFLLWRDIGNGSPYTSSHLLHNGRLNNSTGLVWQMLFLLPLLSVFFPFTCIDILREHYLTVHPLLLSRTHTQTHTHTGPKCQ